jgi:3-hydroxyacyl-[acyl-carrier-protein] dehydratase
MQTVPISRADILSRVKIIMRRDLKLGPDLPIADDMPFFGGDADIDSLDILLLLGSIEREFALKIPSEQVGKQVFQNLATLTDYLQSRLKPEVNASASAPVAPSAADMLARLPHQPPFRFVSRLVNLSPGQSAEGVWSITGSEDFLRGHFPGRPLVPGVLVAEALAQLSGLAKNLGAGDGRLAQVDVRFEQAVSPPAEIQLQSRVVRTMGTLVHYDVIATFNGKTVARGSVTLNFPAVAVEGKPADTGLPS